MPDFFSAQNEHISSYKTVNTTGLIVPSNITEHRFLGYGVTKEQFHSGKMISAFDYIIFISTTTGSLNYYIKNK